MKTVGIDPFSMHIFTYFDPFSKTFQAIFDPFSIKTVLVGTCQEKWTPQIGLDGFHFQEWTSLFSYSLFGFSIVYVFQMFHGVRFHLP